MTPITNRRIVSTLGSFPSQIRSFLRLIATIFWLALTASAHAELTVVTTTPDLAAITKAVGANRVRVLSLALPTQDPHFVDARPHLALELAKADLVVLVGADLEIGWLPTLLEGARNGRIQRGAPGYLEAALLVDLLGVPSGKVDRSMGDVHPQGNPHYLLDPRRAERVAVGIGKRLAQLDPAGHDLYLKATKSFLTELRTKRKAWEARLAPLRGASIITYHRSFPYLADWLGLKVIAELEPKPGIPPDPHHVAKIIALAQSRKAAMLLQEQWFPTGTSKVAASKMGTKLVIVAGMTQFAEGQSYIAFIDALVGRLDADR